MANLTLSVPDDLLKKARKYSLERGISLNAIIRDFLIDLTERKEQLAKASEDFLQFAEAHKGVLEGWKREDLYDL